MDVKSRRLLNIKRIIASRKVSKQDELLDLLRADGFNCTQATLSRDLKQLKVAKMPDIERGSIYVLPELIEKNMYGTSQQISPASGFISINFSVNLCVIKTVPAYSHSIASKLDQASFEDVLGTVAGNDTVMVILTENASREKFIEHLSILIPEVKELDI
jgi:transcriptional regulator of arginine metabolism